MEVPKVIKQIGTVEAARHIYMEDYCITFLKQLAGEEKDGAAALYGDIFVKDNIRNYIIYGAARMEGALSDNLREQAEPLRREFFPQYRFLGTIDLLRHKGRIYDKGPSVTDAAGQAGRGYFIFYEPNEAMENYLVKVHAPTKAPEDRLTTAEQKILHLSHTKFRMPKPEDSLSACGISPEEPESGPLEIIRTIVVGSLIVLCILAITALNSYHKLSGFTDTASHLFNAMEEEAPPEQNITDGRGETSPIETQPPERP